MRRVRLPDAAILVVRGDVLDESLLRRDAARFARRFPEWGRTGISGFYASNNAEVDALCEVRLVQFPRVVVFRRADLDAAGVDVVGTFRTPHVTLAAPNADQLVSRLLSCPCNARINPYHEAE